MSTSAYAFRSINEAFDKCRALDRPIIAVIEDAPYRGTYKVYPSGRADQIRESLTRDQQIGVEAIQFALDCLMAGANADEIIAAYIRGEKKETA